MNAHDITLAQGLSPYIAKQLLYKVRYHFADLPSVTYEDAPPRLVVHTADAELPAELITRVQAMAAELQVVNRTFKKELVLATIVHAPTATATGNAGRARFAADVLPAGEGSVVYRGHALRLVNKIDLLVGTMFGLVGATTVQAPSTIALADLNRINYVPAFHHHLCFVNHLDPHLDKINDFPAAWTARGDQQVPTTFSNFAATPSRAMSPAVCLHVYPMLADQSAGAIAGRWVAARGKVFRFESGNHSDLERLFEFTMHELIHVDTESAVDAAGQKLLKFFAGLADALRLDSRLVVANDLFIGERSQSRLFSQLSTHAKIEWQVRLPHEDRYLAVGSLNLHGSHFTVPLSINDPRTAAPLTSLCLGIGIERLALALASQHDLGAMALLESIRPESLLGDLDPHQASNIRQDP